jgi:hypothetical protein
MPGTEPELGTRCAAHFIMETYAGGARLSVEEDVRWGRKGGVCGWARNATYGRLSTTGPVDGTTSWCSLK